MNMHSILVSLFIIISVGVGVLYSVGSLKKEPLENLVPQNDAISSNSVIDLDMSSNELPSSIVNQSGDQITPGSEVGLIHTYEFVGAVTINNSPETSQIIPVGTTTLSLFQGLQYRVVVQDGTCKLKSDSIFSFVITYDESTGIYTCKEARFLREAGLYGF